MNLAHLGLLAALALGWSDITIEPSKGGRPNPVADLDKPTPRTIETLKRHDLEKLYRSDPDVALQKLKLFASANRRPEAELVFAVAELTWIEGRKLERRRRAEALDRYIDTTCYAYDYLFDPELALGRHPSDPRFRFAIDLYNAGLERLIRASKENGKLQPGETISLRIHGNEQDISVYLPHTPWKADDITQLIVAADYEVSGLSTRSNRYGIGVPLIGVRHAGDREGPVDLSDPFFPEELAFPLTAFLRPRSFLRPDARLRAGVGLDVDEPREVILDLVDTVRWQTVGHGRDALMLEADLTVPLAYMFSRTDLKKVGWRGMLRPDRTADRAGLTLLRPYDPNKIPVVMVHGLMSSPLAWIPMLNELQRDARILENYQFLLYMYPTGVAIPIAATGLREQLRDLQRRFDPSGSDPSFNQMVLLGHSMGGILSHAMAVHSGDHFWFLMSDRRFEDIVGPPEILKEIRRYSYFEAVSFVRRVVFLGTPHRGSPISRGVVGRISSGLISEPDAIATMLSRLVRDNPDAFNPRQFRRLPTSIDTLDTDHPVLQALLRMEPGRDVEFHSIIGSLRPGPVASSTDGVVPYSSSHLPSASSELVVRSDHSVQRAPEAIREVRRILLEHLEAKETAAEHNAEVRR